MVARNVTLHGPLFDGRAAMAVRDFCNDFPEKFAEDGANRVRSMVPWGPEPIHYVDQVGTKRLGPHTVAIVSDSPYGPWLEGKGSRNMVSTFKGYHMFGKTRFWMERTIEPVANVQFKRYLHRMN